MAHQRRPFYNVDAAVGRYQTNSVDDVLLVQTFLSDLAPVHTIFVWERPTKPLIVNGVPDENLYAWIKSYQDGLKVSGYPITNDGIINTVPGAISTQTSITHTKYTLMYLNNHHESLFPEKWRNLPNDPTVHATLRKSLQSNKK